MRNRQVASGVVRMRVNSVGRRVPAPMVASCEDISGGETLEVVVDELGAQGQGVVRLDGGTRLMVPGALPGERVVVRVSENPPYTGDEIDAELVEIRHRADRRRDPLCGRDDACGGCQLRHLTVGAELRFKVRKIQQIVEQFAGIDEDDQPDVQVVTPQPIARGDAFRIRTRVRYRRCGQDFELGLPAGIGDRLIPMHDCPALAGPAQRLVSAVVETLEHQRRLPPDESMRRNDSCEQREALALQQVRIIAPTHGVGLVEIQLSTTEERREFETALFGDVFAPWIEALVEEVPDGVGVAVSSGSHREYVAEPRRIRIPFGRWAIEVGYDDWVHTTLKPAECVYRTMMDWLQLDETDRLVDVGCATGAITLMGSEAAGEVVGVDGNPASIETAEINAAGHGCENVGFVVGGWQRALRELAMDDQQFSVATIHPDRQPLGRRPLAYLEVLGVQRLVYLGPSPRSAARDIGELRDLGWKLQRLAAGNLHPATYHTLLMAAMTL